MVVGGPNITGRRPTLTNVRRLACTAGGNECGTDLYCDTAATGGPKCATQMADGTGACSYAVPSVRATAFLCLGI